jgi:hypothetical protein
VDEWSGNPGLPNGWFPNAPETLTVEQLPASPLRANGRDKVSGGKGNDAINVSTAGPAAKVKCGKGKDIVRYDHDERRRVKGCERRYSIR